MHGEAHVRLLQHYASNKEEKERLAHNKEQRIVAAQKKAMSLQQAAIPVAKKLYEAGGDIKCLKREEMYLFLRAHKVEGINSQSVLTRVLIPKYWELHNRAQEPDVPECNSGSNMQRVW